MPDTLPILEDLPKIDLKRKFASHHKLLNQANTRVLQVRYLRKRVLLVREPEDVAHVLGRRADVFIKHPRQQRLSAWLGEGLGTQPDAAKHAAQREVLAPAFRADYVRQLDRIMAAAAGRLVDSIRRAAAGGPTQLGPENHLQDGLRPAGAAGAGACGAVGSTGDGDGDGDGGGGLLLDAQELFQSYSLDVLGLASLRADLGAMRRTAALGGSQGAATSSSQPGTAESPGAHQPAALPGLPQQQLQLELDLYPELQLERVDLARVNAQLEASALWLLLQLPLVPDDLLPGYRQYEQGVAVLDKLVYGMIRQRRERGVADSDKDLLAFMLRAQQRQQQQQQQAAHLPAGDGSSAAAAASGCPHAAAAAAAMGTGTAVSPPVLEITDKVIRDELIIMFVGGTNSSASILALTTHLLAAHPRVQEAARAEVLEVLAGRPPGELTAEDIRRMPFVAACLNETLRLFPALPEQTRLAAQDEVVGGYQVPRGSTVVASLYSMHRHPAIWPRPEEWLPQRWMPEGSGCPWAYWERGQAAEALGPRQPNAFLPFGTGPRNCIGRNFSLQNMQVTLAALLASTDLLPAPDKPQPDLVYSMTLQPANGVWLRMRPRGA